MPVEIREIIIKTTVEHNDEQREIGHSNNLTLNDEVTDSILKKCEKYVDKKIKENKER
ncbi:MAG: hypothetical protein ACJAUV_000782 [Flavobacteriales bacterium]|jgi:hypothetical protein